MSEMLAGEPNSWSKTTREYASYLQSGMMAQHQRKALQQKIVHTLNHILPGLGQHIKSKHCLECNQETGFLTIYV